MGEGRHKSLVAIFLLILLMSYKVGVTMFVHAHDIDGTMVVHSHPFTSSSHNHSSTQVIAIGQLSTFTGVEYTAYEEIKDLGVAVEEIGTNNSDSKVINASGLRFSLRAPPACC